MEDRDSFKEDNLKQMRAYLAYFSKQLQKGLKEHPTSYTILDRTSINHLDNVDTTIRISKRTKRKLGDLMNPQESYEDIIIRLIEVNKKFHNELVNLRNLSSKNPSLIEYSEKHYTRIHKTHVYHPDLKVEYSYNDSELKFFEEFAYNLEIDGYYLSGQKISEDEAISKIQTIDIINSLSEKKMKYNNEEILEEVSQILDSKVEFIKTKYLLYFKILNSIIQEPGFNKKNEDLFLDKTYWKTIYENLGLSETSFKEDVLEKLKFFEMEIKQFYIDGQRALWQGKLKSKLV